MGYYQQINGGVGGNKKNLTKIYPKQFIYIVSIFDWILIYIYIHTKTHTHTHISTN